MSLNQPIVMEPRQLLKPLRIVWAMMLVWVGIIGLVAVRIHRNATSPPPESFQLGIATMGILTAAVVLYLRFVLISGLFSRSEPLEARALARKMWMIHILSFVFSDAACLFGFVLFILRADSTFYVPLYLGGIVLMLLCFPRIPSGE